MRDRRAVARYAGLTGSPDESGQKRREKGLSRAGNARVRRGMIQLAWRFLMFQKTSALAQWYRVRTKDAGGAVRKTLIVALARKLLISLWRQKTRLQLLTAPVDGMVQQLGIYTVGGVVTPAQSLLVIVPSDSRLEIEATVSNRDIGFVHAGQEAEIKIDTFNFTRYGLLHGQVLSVSQDAIIHERQNDRPRELGTQNDSSEPKGQELNYSAHISLDRTKMRIDDRMVNLTRHGSDSGNQDRIAQDPKLSLVATAPLPAGDLARAVRRVNPLGHCVNRATKKSKEFAPLHRCRGGL